MAIEQSLWYSSMGAMASMDEERLEDETFRRGRIGLGFYFCGRTQRPTPF